MPRKAYLPVTYIDLNAVCAEQCPPGMLAYALEFARF